ncbi:Hypothetical protein HDN1F_15530 [gamma proteobacterium HdN1]|nr:Hypothetical protein HDN1F_15530 [gamma proteobacterium HdN1]
MKQENQNFKFDATPVIDLKRTPVTEGWDNEKTEVFIEDGEGGSGAFLLDANGEYLPISAFPFVMGRGTECDMVLTGKGISRKHAEIIFQSGRFVVNDLDSLNGIKVNGYKLARVILEEGDSIKLGDTTLVFTTNRNKTPQSANDESIGSAADVETATGTEKGGKAKAAGKPRSAQKGTRFALTAAVLVAAVAGGFYVMQTMQNGMLDQRVVAVPNPSQGNTGAAANATKNQQPPNAANTSAAQQAADAGTVASSGSEPTSGSAASSANDGSSVSDGSSSDSSSSDGYAAADQVASNDPPPSIALSFGGASAAAPKVAPPAPKAATPAPKVAPPAPRVAASTSSASQRATAPSAPAQRPVTAASRSSAPNAATLDNRYLSGDVNALVAEMGENIRSGAISDPAYKARYDSYLSLFNQYNSAKQASAEGRLEDEIKALSGFLSAERSRFAGRNSALGRAAGNRLADRLATLGNNAAKTGNSQEAYRYWQKALSYGDSVAARVALDSANQKSQQLYRQALRLEYVNTSRARALWNEVLTIVPPGTEYYTKASSKLAWYDKWGS